MANDNFMNGILDDSDEMIYQDVIESYLPCRLHFLIAGYSSKSDNVLKVLAEKNELNVYRKDNFVRLELFDNVYNSKFLLSGKLDVDSLGNELSEIIKECLKLFGKYINIALVYREENQRRIRYWYKKRVSSKWTSSDNEELKKKLKGFYDIISKNRNLKEGPIDFFFKTEMPKRYIYPGIEYFTEQLPDEAKLSKIIKRLHAEINKSKSFFEMPFDIQSETYHLYHHPKHSLPLPVLLKSPNDMPKPEDYWDFENWSWGEKFDNEGKSIVNKNKLKNVYQNFLDELNSMNLLGYYCHDEECGCFGPHIVLCPENIAKELQIAKKQGANIDLKLLYLIVLIHELAHAMMDKKRAKGTLQSFYAKAMEESLANMITLEWFKEYEESNFNKVRTFIGYQSAIYRFGIRQYDANVDWKKWRDSYKKMHSRLKVWFDSYFDITLLEGYNKVFGQ